MKKILTFILIITLFCSVSITGYAADKVEPAEKAPEYSVRMTYINSVIASLSISSDGLSNSYAKMYAYSGVDSIKISMYLQKYDNGWKTVKHWTKKFDSTHGSLSKDWYVMSGYEYRVLAYYYAYDGSHSESTSLVHKASY